MPEADKPALPAAYVTLADEAMERHQERPIAPRVGVANDLGSWAFSCPYRDEDRDRWQALLFEAFGSRSIGTVSTFLKQLAAQTGQRWDAEQEAWLPDMDELNAVIHIVASLRPQNESQAALAATFVALHLTGMKLAKVIGQMTYPDERTAATLARIAKSQGGIASTIAKLQGVRTTRHETHVHYHNHDERHVHLEGGRETGGQAHETSPNGIAKLPAMSCPQPSGEPMRSARREGQGGVPISWWGKRLWRALRPI